MEPLYCINDFESYEQEQQLVEYYFVGSKPEGIVYDDGYSRKIIPNIDLLYGVENEEGDFSDNNVFGIRIKDFGKWGLIIDGDVVKDFEYDNT